MVQITKARIVAPDRVRGADPAALARRHRTATLRAGDVFLKIDADQARTDVEVEAMAMRRS